MKLTLCLTVLGLGLVFGSAPLAEARNARGATITNNNHIDPTAPHRSKTKTYRLTDSTLRVERCRGCRSVRETQTFDSGKAEIRTYNRLRSR